jgi:hypothetical protein
VVVVEVVEEVVVVVGAIVEVEVVEVVVDDVLVDVVDATVVATATAVVVVVVAITGAAFDDAGSHDSLTEGANPKPPSNTNGAKTTDKRVDERITHRVVKIPTASSAIATNANLTELPVVGKAHTSTANIFASAILIYKRYLNKTISNINSFLRILRPTRRPCTFRSVSRFACFPIKKSGVQAAGSNLNPRNEMG